MAAWGAASVSPVRKCPLVPLGLVGLKFRAFAGERKARRPPQKIAALVSHRQQKPPCRWLDWVKCLKTAQAPAWKASKFHLQALRWGAVQYTYCLRYPLDVSDTQRIPTPHSHPQPTMARLFPPSPSLASCGGDGTEPPSWGAKLWPNFVRRPVSSFPVG